MATQFDDVLSLPGARGDRQKKRATPAGMDPVAAVSNGAASIADRIASIPTNNQPDAYSAAISQPVSLQPLADAGGAVVNALAQGGAATGQAIANGATALGDSAASIGNTASRAMNNLARGDPVKDAAYGIAGGIRNAAGAVGNFFQQSADQARGFDNYSNEGNGRALPPAQAQTIAAQMAAPQPVAAPARPAPVAQPAAPAAQPAAVAAQPAAQPSIGDFAPGTGMVKNNRTGAVTSIGQPAAASPAGPAPQVMFAPSMAMSGAMDSPLRSDQYALVRSHNELMARKDGGIGEALVARGMLNKAKTIGDMADADSNATTSRANADTQAKEAASRAAERASQEADRAAKRGDDNKARELRDQYLALDDKTDPDGKKRSALKSKLDVLIGKDSDKFQPAYNIDPMTGAKTPIGSFDTRTGQHIGLDGKPAKATVNIPTGMKMVGTSNGAPVYEDSKGNRFTQ